MRRCHPHHLGVFLVNGDFVWADIGRGASGGRGLHEWRHSSRSAGFCVRVSVCIEVFFFQIRIVLVYWGEKRKETIAPNAKVPRVARGSSGAAARHPKFRVPALGRHFPSVSGP